MKKFWNWIKNSDDTRILRLEGPIDEESFWGNEVTGEVGTAEFIRQWHMDRDREVYNNNKHLKPPADEHKKKQIREWEEAHPGEKCPDSYNLSLQGQHHGQDRCDCSFGGIRCGNGR